MRDFSVTSLAMLLMLVTFSVAAQKPTLYLTFDDGPDPVFTPRLLDVLKKHNVTATFFVTGRNAEQHPEIVLSAFNAGHTIANHSYAHGKAVQMTSPQILDSYRRTDKIIRDITGQTDVLFRAPYLNISEYSKAFLCANGRNSIDADMSGKDWETQVPEEILANLLIEGTSDGAVILLHDSGQGPQGTRQGTIDATNLLIPLMKTKGFVFATSPPVHRGQLSAKDCN